jgi:hypothetical protein
MKVAERVLSPIRVRIRAIEASSGFLEIIGGNKE